MRRTLLSTPLRVIILLVATGFLLADTVRYYRVQASEAAQPPTQISEGTQPSPVFPSQSPIQNAQNYRVESFALLNTADRARIEAAQISFVGASSSAAISEVSIYQLKYEILGKHGDWKPITAKVYVPVTAGNYPLFVFGSGTTGIADKCAPSLENMAVENLGNYDNQMIGQAAAGYVSVFPDYEGYNDPAATEAYFISESEAKVLLGAIKSLIELQPNTPSLQFADLNSVFLAGYSEGGHAALATAAEWKQLPDTVKLKGVIQYAGASDVEALFLDSPWLASYLVESFTSYYASELNPQSVLQDSWLIQMAKNNQSLCVNAAYRFYPHDPIKMYTPAFLDAIQTHIWPASLQSWQNAVRLNTPLTNLPNVPYLSIQGGSDPIVTAATQRANNDKLCHDQKNLLYREYPGVNHFQIRQVSFTYSNEWMKNVLSYQTPTSNCPQP